MTKELFKVHCIKCKVEYINDENENYYCGSCMTEKQRIAKEVDTKFGSTVGQEPGGELKAYDEALKGSKIPFLKVKL